MKNNGHIILRSETRAGKRCLDRSILVVVLRCYDYTYSMKMKDFNDKIYLVTYNIIYIHNIILRPVGPLRQVDRHPAARLQGII